MSPQVEEGVTVGYALRGHTTVVAVRGDLDNDACGRLADGLEAARLLRDRGPIVVDLSGVGRLAPAAMMHVAQAARDAARVGRELTIEF